MVILMHSCYEYGTLPAIHTLPTISSVNTNTLSLSDPSSHPIHVLPLSYSPSYSMVSVVSYVNFCHAQHTITLQLFDASIYIVTPL